MRNETQWKKIRCHRDLNRKKIKWQDKTPKFLTTKPRILPAKQLQNYANESAWPRGRQMAYSAWVPDGRPRPPSMNIHMGPGQRVKKKISRPSAYHCSAILVAVLWQRNSFAESHSPRPPVGGCPVFTAIFLSVRLWRKDSPESPLGVTAPQHAQQVDLISGGLHSPCHGSVMGKWGFFSWQQPAPPWFRKSSSW